MGRFISSTTTTRRLHGLIRETGNRLSGERISSAIAAFFHVLPNFTAFLDKTEVMGGD